MADEVMTIEGFFSDRTREKDTTMGASFLNGIKDDLMDTKAWVRGAKSAAGGAVGRLAFGALFTHVPYVKDQSAMVKQIAQGLGGVLLGVLAERFVGESAAAGFIGGTSGSVLASLGNEGIGMLSAGAKLSLGQAEEGLSPAERAFLHSLPGERLNEVAVETQNLLNEVAVETQSPLADYAAQDAVLFS